MKHKNCGGYIYDASIFTVFRDVSYSSTKGLVASLFYFKETLVDNSLKELHLVCDKCNSQIKCVDDILIECFSCGYEYPATEILVVGNQLLHHKNKKESCVLRVVFNTDELKKCKTFGEILERAIINE